MKDESRKPMAINQRKNASPPTRMGSEGNRQVQRTNSRSANQVRDVYKYHLRMGSRVIYRGITNDLGRREMEHQQVWPGSRIERVGRRTTRDAALKWERTGGQRSSWHVKQATNLAIDLHREAIKELERH